MLLINQSEHRTAMWAPGDARNSAKVHGEVGGRVVNSFDSAAPSCASCVASAFKWLTKAGPTVRSELDRGEVRNCNGGSWWTDRYLVGIGPLVGAPVFKLEYLHG